MPVTGEPLSQGLRPLFCPSSSMVGVDFTPTSNTNTSDVLLIPIVAQSEPNRGGITLDNIQTVTISFSIGVVFLCALTIALYLYNKRKPYLDPEDPVNLEPSDNYGRGNIKSMSGAWTSRSVHGGKHRGAMSMGSTVQLGLLRHRDDGDDSKLAETVGERVREASPLSRKPGDMPAGTVGKKRISVGPSTPPTVPPPSAKATPM